MGLLAGPQGGAFCSWCTKSAYDVKSCGPGPVPASELHTQRPSQAPVPAGFISALLSNTTVLNSLTADSSQALQLAAELGLNQAALARLLQPQGLPHLTEQLSQQAALCQQGMGLPADAAAVVTNGRLLVMSSATLEVQDSIIADDFGLLVRSVCSVYLSLRAAAC